MTSESGAVSQETVRLLLSLGERSSWGSGPWDTEGDAADWTDPVTGLTCALRRNRMGAWCGYVGVPDGHALHGADARRLLGAVVSGSFESLPGQGLWWFGFDCCGGHDVAPAVSAMFRVSMTISREGIGSDPDAGRTYKDEAHARSRCTRLAAEVGAVDPDLLVGDPQP